jgi:triosephosphate isomerase (TIM)
MAKTVSQMKSLVVGNWKMNGDVGMAESLLAKLAQSVSLSKGHSGGNSGGNSVQVAVCPPFPYLGLAAARLAGSSIAWGAQTVAAQSNGAFTGEVSASMLADLRCSYVLIGHSERRQFFGETDTVVALKTSQAVAAGLIPIICVGETLADREANRFASFISVQVAAALAVLKPGVPFVIAYEPIWAIGTGKTATAAQAQEVHALIRAQLARTGYESQAIPILYGGSVKPANAADIFSQPDIDGGLIGGAALVADDFIAICHAASLNKAKR